LVIKTHPKGNANKSRFFQKEVQVVKYGEKLYVNFMKNLAKTLLPFHDATNRF
jgi:hypothetical protein